MSLENDKKIFLFVKGKVQNVMFRQTIMRAAIKRNLIAGATNHKTDFQRVDISIKGNFNQINEIIEGLKSGKPLNSWGAYCTEVELLEKGLEPLEHEINTSNVDNIKWKKGVKFYL